ncbi:MAG: hypothetical protein ACTSU5_08370 [Promethearchaeota archaeon]
MKLEEIMFEMLRKLCNTPEELMDYFIFRRASAMAKDSNYLAFYAFPSGFEESCIDFEEYFRKTFIRDGFSQNGGFGIEEEKFAEAIEFDNVHYVVDESENNKKFEVRLFRDGTLEVTLNVDSNQDLYNGPDFARKMASVFSKRGVEYTATLVVNFSKNESKFLQKNFRNNNIKLEGTYRNFQKVKVDLKEPEKQNPQWELLKKQLANLLGYPRPILM